jgi:hypothetical protein
VNAIPSPAQPYVEYLMERWRVGEQSERFQASVRRVLGELSGEALLSLRTTKLQVSILPCGLTCDVWAFFPAGGKRKKRHTWGVRMPRVRLESAAEVLLSFNAPNAPKDLRSFEKYLRHHFGHTLLFLRDLEARNECSNADKEWRDNRAITEKKGPRRLHE